MSTETIKFTVEPRELSGGGNAGRLRQEGRLPGVVYGQGKEATMIQFNEHAFEQMLTHHASDNLLMDLELGSGAPKRVLLKEVQHHPLTSKILHVDFQEISMDQKLKLEVPVEYVGTPQGVGLGGTLEVHIRTIELECLPGDVLEQIDMDVSALNIGDSIHVNEISLDPNKYTIHTSGDIMVASVSAPRVATAEEMAEDEAAAAAAAEPERIGGDAEEAGEEG